MVINKKVACIFLLLVMACTNLAAQRGLLQSIDLSDLYRREQLAGSGNKASFLLRSYAVDSVRDKKLSFEGTVIYSLQNNSKLPYGYNDESLFPTSGFQQRISIGLRATAGNLTVQFRPEFVTANNTAPDDLPADFTEGNYWARVYFYNVNNIDRPTRFGTTSITKFFPGQSFISYRFGKASIGISSENIWWGPGMQNSLVMSNNAPGFLHATLKTNAPVQTKIGSFEAQVLLGKLEASDVEPPEEERQRNYSICNGCYEPKLGGDRFISAFMFSWQPKWLPGFYVGAAGSTYFYKGTGLKSARLGSMFFRYAMPEENAEVYGEYGRSNKFASPFSVIGDTIPTGYLVGIRKLFPLNSGNSFIDVYAELTHLSLPDASLIFDRNNPYGKPNPNANSWYTNSVVRHGYTNYGQVMGASIGPGSNSQSINVNWVKGQNKIGLRFDRVVNNNDFYYYNYFNGVFGAGASNRFWVDLALTVYGQWAVNRFIFAGALNYTSALNYKWVKIGGGFSDPAPLSDKTNTQFTLSMLYSFNLPTPKFLTRAKQSQQDEWQRKF